MTLSYTKYFHLAVPDFLSEPWHAEFASAMESIDKALYGVILASTELWKNDHNYVIGDLVYDPQAGSIYSNGVVHTSSSAAIAPTMAAERALHPTYWTTFGLLPTASAGFSAHKSGVAQTGIPSATHTIVTFPTEQYDVGSFYDAPNSRWIPPPSLVSISAGIYVTSGLSIPSDFYVIIAKNGLAYKQAIIKTASASIGAYLTISDQANGTDYYSVVVVGIAPATFALDGNEVGTFFMGHVVQKV